MLKGLNSRNAEILRAYYVSYYHGIRRYVLFNHGCEEDARDLFQEVMLVIFQKVRSGSWTLSCSLGTYLYSVSRFLWLKELDKRKRISGRPVDPDGFADIEPDVAEIADYNERLRIYRRHFEALSPGCQKVLSLFIEGRSIAEITAMMGYKNDQHTRNRRYRCKLSLIGRIRGNNGNHNGNGNDTEN